MCQMTLVQTGNVKANKVIGMTLMTYNSYVHNKDGSGIFNPATGIWKTDITACNITNLGIIVDELEIDDGPLMLHVRASSSLNKELLTKEHAHPFESEHYVFQHNGTLIFKDKAREDEYLGVKIIDSEIFLKELEKNYTGDVYADLKKTMELFNGKFAFIIYHKVTKTFHVVRGRTANLFKQKIKISGIEGFVVNTEQITLDNGLLMAFSFLQLNGFTTEYIGKSEPLEIETFYTVDGINLNTVGKILQTEAPVAVNFTKGGTATQTIVPTVKSLPPHVNGANTTPTGIKKGGLADIIQGFLSVSSLSLNDFDEILFHAFGHGICGYTYNEEEKYKILITGLIRRIDTKTKNMWDIMIKQESPASLYRKYKDELEFPYFLTESSKFKSVYTKVVTKSDTLTDKAPF